MAGAESTPQFLMYDERRASASLNQLISQEWSAGVRYAFSTSDLQVNYPELALLRIGHQGRDFRSQADLHELDFFLAYNRPSGFFAEAHCDCYFQQHSFLPAPGTRDGTTRVGNQSFQQLNFLLGYRLRHQRGELAVGILNALGSDYRLNPITPYNDLHRERVFYLRVRFRI